MYQVCSLSTVLPLGSAFNDLGPFYGPFWKLGVHFGYYFVLKVCFSPKSSYFTWHIAHKFKKKLKFQVGPTKNFCIQKMLGITYKVGASNKFLVKNYF